jgi:ribosomal protein S18 acetylase RimI-like enzyme
MQTNGLAMKTRRNAIKMTSINKVLVKDISLLSSLATQTIIESHGHSAPAEDMNNYIAEKYTEEIFKGELGDPKNIYNFIYHDDQLAGFSKIVFDCPYEGSQLQNITKLDRIYILKKFYEQKLGQQLFQFNVDLAKKNKQAGMWLYVWQENARAIRFYEKNGFRVIGSHDFQVSPTHSNPNHHMLLLF